MDHQWRAICDDFRLMCERLPGVVFFSMKADRPPEISDERIVFNGKRGDHCEPMWLTRDPIHDKTRLVCETRGLAYDGFATALLMIARFHSSDIIHGYRGSAKFSPPLRVTTLAPWTGWTLGYDRGVAGGVHLVQDVLGYPHGFIVDFHGELTWHTQRHDEPRP